MGGIWQCVCGRGVITGFHNIWRMLPTFVRHRSTMLPPLQRAAQPPGQDPILNASDRFILTNEFRMQRRLWDHRGSRLHSSSKVPESCVSVPDTPAPPPPPPPSPEARRACEGTRTASNGRLSDVQNQGGFLLLLYFPSHSHASHANPFSFLKS